MNWHETHFVKQCDDTWWFWHVLWLQLVSLLCDCGKKLFKEDYVSVAATKSDIKWTFSGAKILQKECCLLSVGTVKLRRIFAARPLDLGQSQYTSMHYIRSRRCSPSIWVRMICNQGWIALRYWQKEGGTYGPVVLLLFRNGVYLWVLARVLVKPGHLDECFGSKSW